MNVRLPARMLLLLLLSEAMVLTAFQANARVSSPLQDHKVTGKVTDENSNGLIGVSITRKGSTQGTVSDESGNCAKNNENFTANFFPAIRIWAYY